MLCSRVVAGGCRVLVHLHPAPSAPSLPWEGRAQPRTAPGRIWLLGRGRLHPPPRSCPSLHVLEQWEDAVLNFSAFLPSLSLTSLPFFSAFPAAAKRGNPARSAGECPAPNPPGELAAPVPSPAGGRGAHEVAMGHSGIRPPWHRGYPELDSPFCPLEINPMQYSCIPGGVWGRGVPGVGGS